ncbi:MAG: hypothetical protein KBD24_02310 [Candidatus Pacebacteria bacterium]|nr:hypothetical protein [Candidatus Paceibacterota bacterium]
MNERVHIRHQVPEHDSEYQELREQHHQEGGDRLFGVRRAHFLRKTQEHIHQCERILHELQTVQEQRSATPTHEEEFAQWTQLLDRCREMYEEGANTLRKDFSRVAMQMHIASKHEHSISRRTESARQLLSPLLDSRVGQESTEGEDATDPYMRLTIDLMMDRVSVDDLLRCVDAYADVYEQKCTLLRERVDDIAWDVRRAVLKRVEKGLLPVSAQDALPRIDGLPVYLVDNLLAKSPNILATHGVLGQINVVEYLVEPGNEEELRIAILHEFVHELAGTSTSIGYVNDEPLYATERKSGLSIQGEQRSTFRWLNEAVTEWQALELNGLDGFGDGSYPVERQELKRLFEAGLSKDLVLDAYFENIHSEQAPETKGQHFSALISAINSIEGERGVNRLENQFVMRDIVMLLEDYALVPSEEYSDPDVHFEDFLQVTMRVGARADTWEQKTFRLPRAFLNGEEEMREQVMSMVEDAVAVVQKRYGSRVVCSIAER